MLVCRARSVPSPGIRRCGAPRPVCLPRACACVRRPQLYCEPWTRRAPPLNARSTLRRCAPSGHRSASSSGGSRYSPRRARSRRCWVTRGVRCSRCALCKCGSCARVRVPARPPRPPIPLPRRSLSCRRWCTVRWRRLTRRLPCGSSTGHPPAGWGARSCAATPSPAGRTGRAWRMCPPVISSVSASVTEIVRSV